MNLQKQAAIVGVYEHPARFAPNKSAFQLAAESARAALDEAGLTKADVDGLYTAGLGGTIGALSVCDYLDLHPAHIDTTMIGGSSFVAHAWHAAAAIAAGLCEVALIIYGATNSSQGPERVHFNAEPSHAYEGPYGPTTINGYALVAQRHMHEYGTTAEQLAEIAVVTRMHAGRNPNAKMREPFTVEDVLASRLIAAPLHLLDCCIISDGAGAVVVTSAARARDLPQPPIYILGGGEAMGHQAAGHRNLLDIATVHSGKAAFARAGLAPKDIDMGMIYDSFTITVLTQLEALGFCKPGEGGAFVSGGRLRYDGEFPVNTDGGGLSSNHPGMRGIFLLIEATRQLRGEAGPRQVKKPLRTAVVSGMGGTLSYRHGAASVILANQ